MLVTVVALLSFATYGTRVGGTGARAMRVCNGYSVYGDAVRGTKGMGGVTGMA